MKRGGGRTSWLKQNGKVKIKGLNWNWGWAQCIGVESALRFSLRSRLHSKIARSTIGGVPSPQALIVHSPKGHG